MQADSGRPRIDIYVGGSQLTRSLGNPVVTSGSSLIMKVYDPARPSDNVKPQEISFTDASAKSAAGAEEIAVLTALREIYEDKRWCYSAKGMPAPLIVLHTKQSELVREIPLVVRSSKHAFVKSGNLDATRFNELMSKARYMAVQVASIPNPTDLDELAARNRASELARGQAWKQRGLEQGYKIVIGGVTYEGEDAVMAAINNILRIRIGDGYGGR